MTALFDRILKIHQSGFRQKTGYTCGPASLSLVGEALGLGSIDEGEWIASKFSRWLNVSEFPKRGISLQELLTAAEMTFGDRAAVAIHRAYPEARATFAQDLQDAVAGRLALVLNFTQNHLTGDADGWQGNPHFSPVAGYDEESDRVLIADVDRELSKPYWAKTDRVFEAMAVINPAFQIPRGWLAIRARGSAWKEDQISKRP